MLAIIQARMNSKRLPGKSLMILKNQTILKRVIQQVKKSKIVKKIVVATSKNNKDKAILKFCKREKVECYAGNLNNVVSRFNYIVKRNSYPAFLRVCADSPFLDSKLIDKFITIFKKNNFDILTNVQKRSFPKGQSIEIFGSSFFLKNYKMIKSKKDKEHVTTYFYKNSKLFNIKNITNKKNLSSINMSIDTMKDFLIAETLLKNSEFKKKYISWKKIVSIYKKINSKFYLIKA